MERKFVKVDLHIHTPASKCYKGNKDNEEYLGILRKAKSKRLSIIAITDHNSIEGYRKIKDLELALSKEKETLLTSTSSQATGRLPVIEKDLSLFQDILILPGVEFEVRTGIHLLVIFNNTTPIDVIYKFICDGGYKPADFGEEAPSTLQAWDIFDLYDESKKHDCLVIDAHTDSAKGIWNTLKGQSRANAFKSPQLVAACYKSEAQRNNIQNLLNNVREYKRDIPLSFVKFSDAHENRAIGSLKTWVRVDKVDFESMKQAFYNPSERISTEEPSLAKILDHLLKSETSFGIPDMSSPNMLHFEKLICALNNTNGGYLLFGVSPDKKEMGLSALEKEYPSIINNIIRSLKHVEHRTSGTITIYPLQRNRIIVSVRVSPSRNLTSVKDDSCVYSITNNKLSILSVTEVQRLIEVRVTEDIGGKVTKRLAFLERECRSTQDLLSSIPIIRKFENNSKIALSEPTQGASIDLDSQKIAQLMKVSNGVSRGNLFFVHEAVHPPRLEDTYLRYTLPVFSVPRLRVDSKPVDTIYIVRGGAVYYSPKELPVFTTKPPVLKLHQSRTNTPYGLSFTVCFLKSSFLLWYCKTKFDSVDIFLPEVFTNVRFPIIDTKNTNCIELLRKLKFYFDKILKLEKEYLLKYRKLLRKQEKFEEYTARHNALIDNNAYNIDLIIYELLHLAPDEIRIIEDYLTLNSIYLPAPRQSIRASSQA